MIGQWESRTCLIVCQKFCLKAIYFKIFFKMCLLLLPHIYVNTMEPFRQHILKFRNSYQCVTKSYKYRYPKIYGCGFVLWFINSVQSGLISGSVAIIGACSATYMTRIIQNSVDPEIYENRNLWDPKHAFLYRKATYVVSGPLNNTAVRRMSCQSSQMDNKLMFIIGAALSGQPVIAITVNV